MITDAERIMEIEHMDMETLCRLNRFEPIGSPWFTGDVGTTFIRVLSERRNADPAAWTAASKAVGYDRCSIS